MLPCVRWLQSLLALLSSTMPTWGQNSCPSRCLCPDPHTVNCSGRELSSLPDPLPLDVRRLVLSDNSITGIPSDFLILYSDLVHLDLRNNLLSRIEPGTLSTSSRLVFLDLSCNNLTEIPPGTFGESRSLIKLRLGNNSLLSKVSEDAFKGLTSLWELELQGNALSCLDVRVLSRLPSLRRVRLEGNPWVCNCSFIKLFTWLSENTLKLPTGMKGIECIISKNENRTDLSRLSKESFQKCRVTPMDYIIVIFSGVAVLVAGIVASFFLATTAHCCQRWSETNKGDNDENDA
ncbi:leucine-rich repeat-containing protein 38-like [Paramormyrops kingsleyae]|uniref:Leucine rich repeat containing 38 n=1 Tax=Paramormyrops kingsleyae TaxID=1676925 RepID=A0A3B3SEI9_9TELE|nr:leucine-rich repeat-containing protein 38-like [Paramormyrops kingsleyae]